MQNILVYLGAHAPADKTYTQAVQELGEGLAKRGLTLVYGGSNKGTMATLADAVLRHGGQAIGVSTQALARKLLHPGLTQAIVAADLAERKATMYDLADAIVVMPGSCGTWAELFDALERVKIDKAYGHRVRPIALLNLDGYYDGVVTLLQRSIQAGYSKPRIANLLYLAQTVDELLQWLDDAALCPGKA